jgi:biotin operon repressor
VKHGWLGAVTKSPKLGTNPKVVALVLWNHAKTDGTNAYPSQPRIAQQAGISLATVKRSLSDLERHGWVIRDGFIKSDHGRAVVKWKLVRAVE